MPTIESVARAALGAVDTSAGWLLAAQWAAERYRNIASRTRFRHLRQVGEVVVPANVSTGTVAIVQGSKNVTGSAAASAVWTEALIGRHIRVMATWYEIEQFDKTNAAAKVLKLRSTVTDDTNATAAYTIAARRVLLDPKVRWLGDFVHMRRRVRLNNYTVAKLDFDAPDRHQTGMGPYCWAELWSQNDGAGTQTRPKVIEFYPYPSTAELIHYVYWSLPDRLGPDDLVPQEIDDDILKEATLIDIMRYNASKSANAGNIEQAAYWRNEYRAQGTSVEARILDAIRADKGVDDLTLILQLSGATAGVGREIMTARDVVSERGFGVS